MKSYFIGSFVIFVGAAALVIVGLVGNTPGLVMFSLLCAMPLFIAVFFFALGKASNLYSVIRRGEAQSTRSGLVQRRPTNTEILN
jgi:hypothetical protein